MSLVLTQTAQIRCNHGGTVIIQNEGKKLKFGDSELITKSQILSSTITGCPRDTPCTGIANITVGEATKLSVGNQPILLDTLQGTTNAGGTLNVINAGQSKINVL
jgi:hypothetical protein